jgi:hypothetical protein
MQIKEDEMSGSVARVEEKKTAYGFSVGERERKTLGRPECRWEGNIKLGFR